MKKRTATLCFAWENGRMKPFWSAKLYHQVEMEGRECSSSLLINPLLR